MKIEECRFKQNPDVIYTVLDEEEATLMHFGTKLSYALNQTGQRIWYYLKEGCTIDEIIKNFLEEFNVTPEKARKGIVNLLEELLSFKLITVTKEQKESCRKGDTAIR